MWFANVKLPRELVDAHRAGELVIFVGAGASMGSPSDLPSFWGLTDEIARDAGVTVDPSAKDLDRILGEADANPLIDVHRRVSDRISNPSSRPNELHEAIGALAASGPPVRIVTTNYDRHLSTVMSSHDLAEYQGPALPMGGDFEGIVYLHGTLTQQPRYLICTDEDFGRAYLRDAWAARFLERMFAKYAVLFIGYSHDDVVMTYLARALGPDSRRYVLTPEPVLAKWRMLNITAIPYKTVGYSHQELNDAVTKWATRASMGLIQHRQYVAELVRAAPSGVPEEMSYLESVLADPEKVGFFTEHARGAEWLSWAAGLPELAGLFDGSSSDRALASWFAEHFVMVEQHTEAALQVMQESGGQLGSVVWFEIAFRLHALKGARPRWLGPWLGLMMRFAPENEHDWLDYALVKSSWANDRDTAVLLFDHLVEPRLATKRSILPGRPPTFEVTTRGSLHWLTESWNKVFLPNIAEAASELIVIADARLRHAHRLLTTVGAIRPGWDPLSYGRAAIEPHTQDQFRDPIDVLVDLARDCLEALLPQPSSLAYLESWSRSTVPLLRRLAVHGWTRRDDVNPDLKLAHLRDARWLFDLDLWHEVFELLKVTIGAASTGEADRVVAAVLVAPSDSDRAEYRKLLLLGWILQHAPGIQSASEALVQIQQAHPEFQQREHPEFRSWSETGWTTTNPPTTSDDLHNRLATDPTDAVSWLRQQQSDVDPFAGRYWDAATTMVIATVREHSDDGLRILDAAGDEDSDIVSAVIHGWSGTTLDEEFAAKVVERLGQRDLTEIARDVASLLAEGSRSTPRATPWAEISGSEELAIRAWDALPSSPLDEPVNDWLTDAINDPAGWLTQFWLEVIATRWRADTDAWTGLPATLRSRLESLLASHDNRSAMAEVILASRLHFLHGADPAWAEATILPLLGWGDQQRARRAWDGFLNWGRFNNRLLDAGLLEHYLAAAGHVQMFSTELARQLLDHLAAVALYADDDPLRGGWGDRFTRSTTVETRTLWFERIAWLLAEIDPPAVEHQWNRWMREYWQNRLRHIPLGLSIDEASALATWTAYLTTSAEEGVGLALEHPAHLNQHSRLLDDLSDHIDNAPTAFAALLIHLLKGTNSPFPNAYQFADLVRALRPTVDVNPIIEQLLRLGYSDAPNW